MAHAEGTRRVYVVRTEPLQEVDVWLERHRGFWRNRMGALETEVALGRRQERDDESDEQQEER